MDQEAIHVLARDAVMARLIALYPDQRVLPSGRPVFEDLVKSIIHQQLSVKAASTIYGRFLGLFPNDSFEPASLASTSETNLRSAGISRQKIGYLFEIAKAFSKKDYRDQDWNHLQNDEIVRRLTAIKGVGIWTAKMILIFCLGKKDVFAPEDLGVRLAMIDLYHLNAEGKILIRQLKDISSHWTPYRSLACQLLWSWKDDPSHSSN